MLAGPWALRRVGIPKYKFGFKSFFAFWLGGGSVSSSMPGLGNILPYRRHRRRSR